MTANTTENTTGAGETAAQILDRATLPLAYHWKATADKAAMIVEFLGVQSIHSPLFVAMEDAIEARFDELITADNNKPHWLNKALGWRIEAGKRGWDLFNQFGFAGTFDSFAAALAADAAMSREP
jgi:hypothetical protein